METDKEQFRERQGTAKMTNGTVWLKRGREKSVLRHHPWLFSGAIQRVENAGPGEIVTVRAADNTFLARGYYNSRSQIRVRLLTWNRDQPIDAAFWRRRVAAAWARRNAITRGKGDAWRAVHAENDQLPGLVVDMYGDWMVVQQLTLGIVQAWPYLLPALVEIAQPRGILERSDVPARKEEGLSPKVGQLWGETPPEEVIIHEAGYQIAVDLWHGQKTGYYLDQRLNRAYVARWAAGRELLNAFSYTGGFAVHALGAGAKFVLNVDASATALAWGKANLQRNGFSPDHFASQQGDVFQLLRRYRQEKRTFDMIILDPPKFATSKRTLIRATRGYKDINMLALQCLRPGGTLATFSCSGLVTPDLFQKVVFAASIDAGVEAQILADLEQPPDHPVLLSFPEGRYLKGLLLRRL